MNIEHRKSAKAKVYSFKKNVDVDKVLMRIIKPKKGDKIAKLGDVKGITTGTVILKENIIYIFVKVNLKIQSTLKNVVCQRKRKKWNPTW